MTADSGWEAGTWEGSRKLQHKAFQALSFRDKLAAIEEMSEVAARVREQRVPSPSAHRADGRGTDQAR
jgi:hypothetical protein